MKVEIIDSNDELGKDFGLWLIRRIQFKFRLGLIPEKLKQWDKYFAESDEYQTITDVPVKTADILLFGVQNLQCWETPDKIIIQLPKNLFVPNMDRVNLDKIFRLITFGNQQIKGYPLFIDVLRDVVDNIDDYVEKYNEGF